MVEFRISIKTGMTSAYEHVYKSTPRKGGSVRASDLRSGGPGFKSRSHHKLAALVNSQLIPVLPAGILNHLIFVSFFVSSLKSPFRGEDN